MDGSPYLDPEAQTVDGRDCAEPAEALLERALRSRAFGVPAVVSSFGADSAVLLHMTSGIDRGATVLFVDTGQHFPQTLAYRDQLADLLGLTGVTTVRPSREALMRDDPKATLHQEDPDGCCQLRKVRPLDVALAPFDVWIAGVRRHQSSLRRALPRRERDRAGRIKLNPLADWSQAAVTDYLRRHDLPEHPLVAQGFPSIGCAPCTTRAEAGEDARAGRWRGRQKTECGLHFPLGTGPRRGEVGTAS